MPIGLDSKSMTEEEQVVLVDEQGHELGLMGKTEAHERGILHKAISVLIFNSQGDMLIQQRAFSKYHWAGIWSNTCCSHPRDGETFEDAAQRRLKEELGIVTPLKKEFYFTYKATDGDSGLTEHEYDWVFTGVYDESFEFNTDEIHDVKWIGKEELANDMEEHPELYSFWFPIILENMQAKGTY
jgi:isopentenyl-diphosphate delta-isomerase